MMSIFDWLVRRSLTDSAPVIVTDSKPGSKLKG